MVVLQPLLMCGAAILFVIAVGDGSLNILANAFYQSNSKLPPASFELEGKPSYPHSRPPVSLLVCGAAMLFLMLLQMCGCF
jgi:hypothetical protein